MKAEQDLIINNNFISHLVKHQKKYLLAIFTIISIVPFLANIIRNRPVLMKGESYYFLQKLDLTLFVPQSLSVIIAYLIGIATILLLFKLAEKMKLADNFTFFFVLFLILSPTFIFSYVTLSFYSWFLLLALVGFLLLHSRKEKLRYLSIIPFALAMLIDSYSSILLLALQLMYFSTKAKEKKEAHEKNFFQDKLLYFVPGTTLLLLVLNRFILKIPFFIGPFHVGQGMIDFISDLGGLSGISFFIFIMALFGLAVTWKKKNFYFAYLLLPLMIPAYAFNTNTIFFLSLLMVFFAATGFVRLFERSWTLTALKKITFFILILGILFSSLTYIDRIQDYQPSLADKEALSWLKSNTLEEVIVASAPENSYYIRHFAEREPFYNPNIDSREKKELNEKIFSSTYIQDLFPILENNSISIIYLSKDMKDELPKDQGLLFLLKNERFKLIYSSEESEAWLFKKEVKEKK